MQISILALTMRNFKGIRDLHIDFNKAETNIDGDNGTGKTSIADAVYWVLFGKDSNDKKDFEIKTLDKQGIAIPRLDHEVTAVLDCDGIHYTFKSILREKWVTARGSEVEEFKGHETLYYFNDVPMQQKEYRKEVSALLDENIDKMVTNPLYFNTLMKWTDRRIILGKLAGGIGDDEIAKGNESFEKLIQHITSKKVTLTQYKPEISAKKKKAKEELEGIGPRIDEVNRAMPKEVDEVSIGTQIDLKQQQIQTIDDGLDNQQKGYQELLNAAKEKEQDKFKLEKKRREILAGLETDKANSIAEIEKKCREISRKIKADSDERAENLIVISSNINRITKTNLEKKKLLEDWNALNEKEIVFDPTKFECPTCKRELEPGQITDIKEKLTEHFNDDKTKKLATITETGQSLAKLVQTLEAKNENLQIVNGQLTTAIETNQKELDLLYSGLQTEKDRVIIEPGEIKLLDQQIAAIGTIETPTFDNKEQREKRAAIQNEIEELRMQLGGKALKEKLNARIEEINQQQKDLAQLVANYDKAEFIIEAFSKARITEIETRINHKFALVTWKMFDQQVNGGETECCECMVNGVPFSDVNTAGQINAGIDIINALSEHYGLYAPIFIDNRESINKILACKSQIINLIVSKSPVLNISKAA